MELVQEEGLVHNMERQEEGPYQGVGHQDKEVVHRLGTLDLDMVLVQGEAEGNQKLIQIQEVVPEEVYQWEGLEDKDTGLQGKAEQGLAAPLLQYWVQQLQL